MYATQYVLGNTSQIIVVFVWEDDVQLEGMPDPMEGVVTQAEANLAAQRAREVIHVKCHHIS